MFFLHLYGHFITTTARSKSNDKMLFIFYVSFHHYTHIIVFAAVVCRKVLTVLLENAGRYIPYFACFEYFGRNLNVNCRHILVFN